MAIPLKMRVMGVRLLVIFAILAFSRVAVAEEPTQPVLVSGVRLGLSANQLLGSDAAGVDLEARYGATGGFFTGVRYRNLEFLAEAQVASRGAEFSRGQAAGSLALYYLDFPVTGGMVFPFGDGSLEARAYGGASIGYRLAAVLRDTTNTNEDMVATTRDVDFGVLGGVGLSWGKSDVLLFDLRFYLGLRDVADGNTRMAQGGKNGSISFLLGYRL